MLRRGGNAVDAAVAASFAISVIRPQSTGIGGGGFLLLYLAKEQKTLAIDFRERAPLKATRDMFVRDGKAVPSLSRAGPLSVAVPGVGEDAKFPKGIYRFSTPNLFRSFRRQCL